MLDQRTAQRALRVIRHADCPDIVLRQGRDSMQLIDGVAAIRARDHLPIPSQRILGGKQTKNQPKQRISLHGDCVSIL